jgi:hypothetical protein
MPRLWPDPKCWYPLDAVEDIVLVRLGGNGFEALERLDEAVEAFDECRNGLDLDTGLVV